MTDVVQIGDATLYHGDCLDILKGQTLPPVDLIITSPPYNVHKQWWGDRHRAGMHEAMQRKFADEWYPDEMPEGEYQEWQKQVLRECVLLAPVTCYNHKVRYAIKRQGAVFHPMAFLGEFPLWSEIIWYRGGGPAQNCRRPVPADERIYVFSTRPPVWNDCGHTSVWSIPPVAQNVGHPCPFPPQIPDRCQEMFTNMGATVCDPFMGAGTTGIVAIKGGRKFIGIEIERKYFDIACERIDNAYRQARMFA